MFAYNKEKFSLLQIGCYLPSYSHTLAEPLYDQGDIHFLEQMMFLANTISRIPLRYKVSNDWI
jgi:hypothetical protein